MIADLKLALRMLARTPGFTATAVLTLGLGIGCATAIFSVIDAVLLRPFPFPQQERIVELRELDENGHAMAFAELNFDDLRARSRSFEALANYNYDTQSVSGGSEPVQVNVAAVSEDFFRVLAVTPSKAGCSHLNPELMLPLSATVSGNDLSALAGTWRTRRCAAPATAWPSSAFCRRIGLSHPMSMSGFHAQFIRRVTHEPVTIFAPSEGFAPPFRKRRQPRKSPQSVSSSGDSTARELMLPASG